MRVLFLDDMEHRHQAFLKAARRTPDCVVVCCWTAAQAILQLDSDEPFDVAFLDHDLDDAHYAVVGQEDWGEAARERSGMAVAQHVAEMPEHRRPRRTVIHSWNGPASVAMCKLLHAAGVPVARIPFDPTWWRVPTL